MSVLLFIEIITVQASKTIEKMETIKAQLKQLKQLQQQQFDSSYY